MQSREAASELSNNEAGIAIAEIRPSLASTSYSERTGKFVEYVTYADATE